MAIVGTGVDLVEVARVRAAIEQPGSGARFVARIFTAGEQAYANSRGAGRSESYAARFAAKEATMKALGIGWGADASWLDIEIVRGAEGRPSIVLSGGAAATAAAAGFARLHLALTHTATHALAHVIAED